MSGSLPSRADLPGEEHDPRGALPGVVYLVGAGPGDPGLLTVRAARLIQTADVVLHDELVHPAVIEGARAGALVRSVGKRGGKPSEKQAKQSEIEADLVALARAGRSVVRLKGGDPFMFGRGSEEAEALARAEVPFEVVPGVCSPLGATAYAGISVTHRDLASSVVFVSATTRAGEDFDWTEMSQVRGTICVLMGMHKLGAVTLSLIEKAKRDPATPAAVVQWGTRADQAVVCGRLDEIDAQAKAKSMSSPAILVVGAVARLRSTLRWFDKRPLFGKRVLITRPKGQAFATSELIRLRGGEPVEWPVISIEPPPDPERVRRAVQEMGAYDVVAFTSENGVTWFFQQVEAAGRDARGFGHAKVAAIGPGTAAALRVRGVRADIVPVEFRGETLAEAILDDPAIAALRASGRAPRVLIARALVAREILADLLRQGGCAVDVVAVYETRPAPIERQTELIRMFEQRRIDIVLFTASSTIDSLCDLLGARAVRLLDGVFIASIGPITSRTAERRGLSVGVTAEVSTTEGLVDALERALSTFSGSSGS